MGGRSAGDPGGGGARLRPAVPVGLGFGEMPPPPPGFVPPPLARFDARWRRLARTPRNGRRPVESFSGPAALGPASPPAACRWPFGAGGSARLGDRIFGPAARLFRLEFLWFLWYLLIFATIAPWLVKIPARLFPDEDPGEGTEFDRAGRGAALAGPGPPGRSGLIGGLAQMIAPNPSGWSLPLASGIFRGVPDFAYHLEPDMPFYLTYFLAGWWLHRERDALPGSPGPGCPTSWPGLAAHAAARPGWMHSYRNRATAAGALSARRFAWASYTCSIASARRLHGVRVSCVFFSAIWTGQARRRPLSGRHGALGLSGASAAPGSCGSWRWSGSVWASAVVGVEGALAALLDIVGGGGIAALRGAGPANVSGPVLWPRREGPGGVQMTRGDVGRRGLICKGGRIVLSEPRRHRHRRRGSLRSTQGDSTSPPR